MKDKNLLPTTMPIQIQIKNISDKIYENISVFDYKRKTNLIYSSILEPIITYEDILRFLTSIRLDDEKKISSIYIRATCENDENLKNQLNKNHFTYKITSIDGRVSETKVNFPEIELHELSYVWVPLNNFILYNRSNLLLGKLYPHTTVDILIHPSEETNFF